jgi:hypothetical protein
MTSALALVCKVLLDREVLELRSENERLKLRLFWKTYGPEQLRAAMEDANAIRINCECIRCAACGRHNGRAGWYTCEFEPWFHAQLAQCELESAAIDAQSQHFDLDGMTVWDTDAHFVHCEGPMQFSYGKKLHAATSIKNEELQKLKKLFAILTE